MLTNKYTAEEVANIISQRGDAAITKRTVNYYAFEKNMFDIINTGKKCFTALEIDKIIAIRLLQTHTKLKLDEIKVIINSLSLEEIQKQYLQPVRSTGQKEIIIDENITLLVNNKLNKDRLNKIISHIKNVF